MALVLRIKLKTKIIFSGTISWLLAILAIFSNLNLLTSPIIILFGSNKPHIEPIAKYTNNIVEIAKKNNFDTILGEFIPTKKNVIVKNHYKDLGFKKGKYWELNVKNFTPCNYPTNSLY